jgi:hypothetical protein
LAILSIFLWRRWVAGPLVALGISTPFYRMWQTAGTGKD